jgi:predicted HAD superfamily Cof-like phosphohydrolase
MNDTEVLKHFHKTFGHPVAEVPVPGSVELRHLRLKLIAEELAELADALCFNFTYELEPMIKVGGHSTYDVDLVEAADACGDLRVVVVGTEVALGLPGQEVFAEIARSNLSKLDDDGKPILRADGKLLKGPHYVPPNITRLIELATLHGTYNIPKEET